VGQVQLFPTIVVLVAALVAAAIDVWKYKIHNALALPLLVSGLIFHAATGGMSALAGSAAGALAGFGSLIIFYILGGMGAGDVKLMTAVGAWLGLPLTFYVFIASALAAGLYALVLLVLRGSLKETWLNLQLIWLRMTSIIRHLGADERVESEIQRSDRRLRVIPFAAMIAVGLVSTLIWLKLRGS
jgi:prepilin peptidase CpaA